MHPLILKEFRLLWRCASLRWLLITTLALQALAQWAVCGPLAHRAQSQAQAAKAERQRWLNQGEQFAHAAAHYGQYVFRPISALSTFDRGIDAYVGSAVLLEAHRQNDTLYRPGQETALALAWGPITPATVLLIVGPLLIIGLGHGIVAQEWELGTFRLLCLQQKPLRTVLIAKTLTLAIIGAGMVAISLLLAWGSSRLLGFAQPSDALSCWLGLAIVYMAYISVWIGLTIALSSMLRHSQMALAFGLSLWVVLCLIVPRAAATYAHLCWPLPSQEAWFGQMNQAAARATQVDDSESIQRALMTQAGVHRLEDLPTNWAGANYLHGEALGNAIFTRYYRFIDDQYLRQQETLTCAAFLSPTLATQWLSQALSGSDIQHDRHFVAAAEAYRRTIQLILNTAIASHPMRDGAKPLSGAETWKAVPPFTYQLPRFATVIDRADWLRSAAALSVALLLSTWVCLAASSAMSRSR